MIYTSEEINEISGALAKAQAELENVEKGGKNPHFHSKYATLGDVLSEVRPKFAKHGIAIIQMPTNYGESEVSVVTRFVHGSGQFIESIIHVAPTKFDAQGAGSVITYLRRYALMAMAGIGADDDDGNAAVGRPVERARPNGHISPPPPLPAPPAPPAPPHDPSTGEIKPHRITLPITPDGRPNYVLWGGQLIAAIKSAGNYAEWLAWQHENAAFIAECAERAPKAARSIKAAIDKTAEQYGEVDETLSEDDVGQVLNG